jgi:proteasome lid subunit RPN8/RPN11
MLRLPPHAYAAIIGHAYDGLPDEACGLLVGDAAINRVTSFEPTANEAASSKLYTIPAKDFLRIDRDAEAAGRQVIGVVHSHTHTDAYPSPTDVAQAPDPAWHYVIVSLRDDAPVLRSYRIVDEAITEERVVVDG